MKSIKPIILTASFLILLASCKENKPSGELQKNQQEETIDLSKEKEAVLQTMKSYKDVIQNLTTEGSFELFAEDSKVFEQGKAEGTYKNYIAHHLGPELGHFKSFTFSDYKIDATVNLPYAFTTETYKYTIVLKADKAKNTKERTIESKGVATSVLKKTKGSWKIMR